MIWQILFCLAQLAGSIIAILGLAFYVFDDSSVFAIKAMTSGAVIIVSSFGIRQAFIGFSEIEDEREAAEPDLMGKPKKPK